MNQLKRLLLTSVGRKLTMALTGLGLFGFVLVHMLGNMTIFQGPDRLNAYAAWLQNHPLIWLARSGLLGIFALHIWTALTLVGDARKARGGRYASQQLIAATPSSRSIVYTGVGLLLFVIFHLLHFTFGAVQSEGFHSTDASGRHDVFAMVVAGFQQPQWAALYVLAMLVLGFHLSHALKSVLQTLGLNHASYNAVLSVGGRLLVGLIVVGNCSFPILIYLGVINGGGK